MVTAGLKWDLHNNSALFRRAHVHVFTVSLKMKQITQDLKQGRTLLNVVPRPSCSAGTLLVATRGTLVSLGTCLLYTSDAADERSSVDLGGRRTIKKKK